LEEAKPKDRATPWQVKDETMLWHDVQLNCYQLRVN
jgi:hypothetical protein